MRNIFYALAIGIGVVLSFAFIQPGAGNRNPIVEGVVLDDASGKPLSNTHVYIIHGEEEALTNAKGQFSIETSKKFPLILTAHHEGYVKFQMTVGAAGQRQVIRLKR